MTHRLSALALLALSCLAYPCWLAAAEKAPVVRLDLAGQELTPPAKYGLERLQAALKERGCELDAKAPADTPRVLLVGQYTDPHIYEAVGDGLIGMLKMPEALAVKRDTVNGIDRVTVAGYDEVGLMYALLDLADAVINAPDATKWFESIADATEKPANSMRRMRVMMHHAANEKEWYHSLEYWDWYIGMLATNRFNGLNLVYSHQSPYMAPMYAWHLKIDEFPEVRPIGITDEDRDENLKVMRHIAKLCHERGIELTIGVWQHLPWMNEYLQSREDQEVLIHGLTPKNVGRYTYLAVQKLLKECPGIARIQIRPNDESGIHLSEQTAFYRDNVMKAIKDSGTNVKLDLRTVGVSSKTIQAAREADLGVRTSIKFFGEFMGQPYTPREELTLGYSYSAYLQKPMPNPVYNEVWVLGSHRVLLWGSEEYGREFGRNASYGGTIGFETDGPLAQKGYQKPTGEAWRLFNNKEDEYYTHEIERYWAFFRAIGRFGYNPDASHEVWMRPFHKRFGDAATAMAEAYESASKVIGLIVVSHVENPNMYTWPELSMGGLISAYTSLRGMDKGLFPSIDDQVDDELAGRVNGHTGPNRLADIFDKAADQTTAALKASEGKIDATNKEYRATTKDFEILSHLAHYHAHRQREGYGMAKFYRTSDASLLPGALAESEGALDQWKQLVAIATPQYYAHIQTGPIENGHWSDKTFLVETNTKIIREAAETLHRHGLFDWGFDFGPPARMNPIKDFFFWKYGNDFAQERRFVGLDPNSMYAPRPGYGFLDNRDLEATAHPMKKIVNLGGAAPDPKSPVPLDLIAGDFISSTKPMTFRMDLPMDKYRMTFVFADHSEKPRDHGPFKVQTVDGKQRFGIGKAIRVPAGETVIRHVDQDIRENGWDPYWIFGLAPAEDGADAVISGLTIHRFAPKLAHAPRRRVSPQEPCKLSATITMPPQPTSDKKDVSAAPGKRVTHATLRYRTAADAPYDSLSLSTEDGFVYSATIPTEKLQASAATSGGKWLEYYFSATDKAGRVTQLPDVAENRVFRARLTADSSPPQIVHEPIKEAPANKPLHIEAKATDADGVATMRAYYRRMDQSIPYDCVVLERRGDTFVGDIPVEAISPKFDFVYYLEAVDEAGVGCYFPDWQKTMPYVIVKIEAGK